MYKDVHIILSSDIRYMHDSSVRRSWTNGTDRNDWTIGGVSYGCHGSYGGSGNGWSARAIGTVGTPGGHRRYRSIRSNGMGRTSYGRCNGSERKPRYRWNDRTHGIHWIHRIAGGYRALRKLVLCGGGRTCWIDWIHGGHWSIGSDGIRCGRRNRTDRGIGDDRRDRTKRNNRSIRRRRPCGGHAGDYGSGRI